MMSFFFWFFTALIVYTYAGYPAILGLWARRKKRRTVSQVPPPASEWPTLTLLISAYNEETSIAQKLENSLALAYPRDRLQILVTADGSDDRTPELVRGFADRGVELTYSPPRAGKMAAINRAMPLARGAIVVFSDANNHYSPNALQALAAPFADRTVGVVSGSKTVVQDGGALGESEGLYWKYESRIKAWETTLGGCSGVSGEILAIRRDLFETPPNHVINDDFFMAMRIARRGYRIVYAPEARSSEKVSPTAQDEIERRARMVAGRYQAIALAPELLPWQQPRVVWQVISHKFLRPLVPLAMIGALLANLLAVCFPARRHKHLGDLFRLAPPFNWLILLAQVAFYALAFLGDTFKPGGLLGKVLYLPTFLVNSNLAALMGLARFLTGRQTTLWQRVRRGE